MTIYACEIDCQLDYYKLRTLVEQSCSASKKELKSIKCTLVFHRVHKILQEQPLTILRPPVLEKLISVFWKKVYHRQQARVMGYDY